MTKRVHRLTGRSALLPKKVVKEQKKFDFQLYMMNQQITKAFPDPTDRLHYINSLMAAMDKPSQEVPPLDGTEVAH
jgi:hypothetical protein